MNFLELAVSLALTWSTMGDTTICYNDPEPNTIVKPDSGYAIQYIFPGWSQSGWWQLERWGFVNNDASTVWPGAGAIVMPDSGQYSTRFPTKQELENSLTTGPFSGPELDVTIVNLINESIMISPYQDAAFVLVLKIPPGTPSIPSAGPGFLAADKLGTQCSYFTLNGVDWWAPTTFEWAWAAEIAALTTSDVLPVSKNTWSNIKRIYR